jgi:hypothetical protein
MHKRITWTEEAETLLEALIRREGDAPSQSEMLRRLVYRASDLPDPPRPLQGNPKLRKNKPEISQLGLRAGTQSIILGMGVSTVDQLRQLDLKTLPSAARREVERVLSEL